MKYLILAFLIYPSSTHPIPFFDPTAFYVVEVTDHQCRIEGQPISCAYLLAIYNQMKSRCPECDWKLKSL